MLLFVMPTKDMCPLDMMSLLADVTAANSPVPPPYGVTPTS